jgi:hypothetical protein
VSLEDDGHEGGTKMEREAAVFSFSEKLGVAVEARRLW